MREPQNVHDRYEIAVKKYGTVIGHLPRKVSRVGLLLLKRGGSIHVQSRESEDTLLTYRKEALRFRALLYSRPILRRSRN